MTRRTFTREFKDEAVKLVVEQGVTKSQVCRDLGISYTVLDRWVRESKQHGSQAFPGKGKLMPQDAQIQKLEKDVRRLTIERDILKKTIGYFAEKP